MPHAVRARTALVASLLTSTIIAPKVADAQRTPGTVSRPAAPPPFVRAVDSAPVARTTPATAPADWRLAFLDVETTGLVPGWHEMIDIGVVLTDLEGRVIDSLFLRVMPDHPERLSPGAQRVNGFHAATWRRRRALAPRQAVDSLVAWHRARAGGHPTMLVAFNSQFDAAFLDHLFRTRGTSWRTLYHYFVLDVPSMAWSLGYRELTGAALAARLGVPDEPRVADEHTGITGAMLNVRIYQALRARGAAAPAPVPR